MFKFFVSLFMLLLVAGGLWWSGYLSKWVPSIPTYQSLMSSKTATTTPIVPVTQQQQAPQSDLPTAANDASDQALVQDTAALDAEINAFATDNANAQNTLTDKPVTQEY
jgi:uncharacterized iron-regulated membrane protein